MTGAEILDLFGKGMTAAAGVLSVVAPIAWPFVARHLDNQQRDRLRRATKGAYAIVSKLAEGTNLPAAQGLEQVIGLVRDELDAPLSHEDETYVARVAASLHADASVPGAIGTGVVVPKGENADAILAKVSK